MLDNKWNDKGIEKKADKAGIEKNHKYRDRARTIVVKQSFIDSYLSDYKNGEKPSANVLDISTGTGVFVELMNEYGNTAKGTELDDCPYNIYHKSQNIEVVYCDTIKTLPFKKGEFDLVTCVGAFNVYPVRSWGKIFRDIFRIAASTVVIGINQDDIYEENKEIFDKCPKGWSLTIHNKSFYRWDHN